MRTRVDTNEVAHLWAHQTQNEARNGSGARNNFYFEGDTIYSYGRHFPIARHIETEKGKAILFTTRTYSITTSGHINLVRGAIPDGVRVFHIEDPSRMPDGRDITAKENKAADYVAKAKRARVNREGLLTSAKNLLDEASELVEFFDLKLGRPVLTMDGLGVLAGEIEAARKKDAAEKKARQQAAIKKAQEDLELWKNGESVNTYLFSGLPFAFGRIEGAELVTTKGARVPVEHVAKVSKLVRKIITEGKTYKANGHTIHLGHYVLNEIDANGMLRAGCHRFEKTEVLRILDLIDKLS